MSGAPIPFASFEVFMVGIIIVLGALLYLHVVMLCNWFDAERATRSARTYYYPRPQRRLQSSYYP